jgi:predicted trehalose synthase
VIDVDDLRATLGDYIPRQRWFGNRDRTVERVGAVEQELLATGWPALVWVTATLEFDRGFPTRYHVPLGLDQAAPMACADTDSGLLGPVDTDAGPAIAYDATRDDALARALLAVIAPDEGVSAMRPMGGEQSNTSLVYDDRLVLKLYRRPPDGPNPDAEVTAALAAGGFPNVAPVLGRWVQDGVDRAIVQPFLRAGADGWVLAVASVPAGADAFVSQASQLGQVTARLHVALAAAFGKEASDPGAWVAMVASQLARTGDPRIDAAAVAAVTAAMGAVPDTGASIRVHGDYHLGQTLHTRDGWFVLDFEGEPARPLTERRAPSSPLKDVAGMLRSFDYASRVAGLESGVPQETARAWEECTRRAFLDTYAVEITGHGLVPEGDAFTTVLAVFELDKAIYEVAYEAAHRPDWIDIPLAAVARLLES